MGSLEIKLPKPPIPIAPPPPPPPISQHLLFLTNTLSNELNQNISSPSFAKEQQLLYKNFLRSYIFNFERRTSSKHKYRFKCRRIESVYLDYLDFDSYSNSKTSDLNSYEDSQNQTTRNYFEKSANDIILESTSTTKLSYDNQPFFNLTNSLLLFNIILIPVLLVIFGFLSKK